MWIFLGILLFLVCIITVILLLPVYVIIKSNEEDSLYFRYKFLGKTFGENPDPNDPIIKSLKTASGISRLEKDTIKKNIRDNNLIKTLREDFTLVVDLLKELLGLVKRCKAKVFKLEIVCANSDAAEAAIKYGTCCAVAYPLLGYLRSLIRIKSSGEDVNISCDFNSDESHFSFETILVIPVYRVLGAFLRAAFKEAKRLADAPEKTNSRKNQE